jgi:hypothetical protein
LVGTANELKRSLMLPNWQSKWTSFGHDYPFDNLNKKEIIMCTPLQNDLLINMRKMAIPGDAIRLQFSFWSMPSTVEKY